MLVTNCRSGCINELASRLLQAEATANTVRALHETWLMNIEDLASNHGDLVLRLKSASAKSSKALELGWRSLGQLEDGAAEDWTQVYPTADWDTLDFSP